MSAGSCGLTLLAPDIAERIIDGRPTAGLAQFLEAVPVDVGADSAEHFLCAAGSNGPSSPHPTVRADPVKSPDEVALFSRGVRLNYCKGALDQGAAPAGDAGLLYDLMLLRAHRTIAGPLA